MRGADTLGCLKSTRVAALMRIPAVDNARLRGLTVPALALLFVFVSVAWASTESVLFEFNGTDGSGPEGTLVADQAGNFYGTAFNGGNAGCYLGYGCGVVFELTPSQGGWTETVLYAFTGGRDGASPAAGLLLDNNGNLYGTTVVGGNLALCNDLGPAPGCGVVFKLTRSTSGWTYSAIHRFSGGDGAAPYSNLILDRAGNLYGTTRYGGSGCDAGCGTVFRLEPTNHGWTEAVLYDFTEGLEGGYPFAGVIQDNAGNLYGTTSSGGLYSYGVVFKLARLRRGWKETVLHSFPGGSNGGTPIGGVIADPVGNLYGTATIGGNQVCYHFSCGVVFELTPAKHGHWKPKVIHYFEGPNGADGSEPYASLTRNDKGQLFGTTVAGGSSNNAGTVFEVAMVNGAWKETVLYIFSGSADGGYLFGGVYLDDLGNVYGTTSSGGNTFCLEGAPCGVVFEIVP
jgi:uncharacterized repeat protein (TIGR03803 family)